MPAYVTQQSVLQDAGLWQRVLAETPAGLANASNKVFIVDHKPLADNNYDDTVDANDVVVYVNSASVSVASVDATTGEITTVTAPANGAAVTVDYSYSNISTDYVDELIDDAEAWINEEMAQIETTPYSPVPKSVRRIARTYAAGLLMLREYGLQGLTEEVSKEGQRKIELAERWLAAYRTRIESNGADTGPVVVPRSSTDSRLFQSYDESEGLWTPLSDEHFTVNGV